MNSRLLPFLFLLLSSHLFGQKSTNNLDSLIQEVELLIGDEWFLEETKDGFQVTFCRSCNEIHFVSFDSEEDLNAFLKDDERLTFKHLKDASVESVLLVKGEKL